MSKHFCVLPRGYSEACALNCRRRHHHYTLKVINELLAADRIEFHDTHPLTNLPRYILTRLYSGIPRSTEISPIVIAAGAGVYGARELATARKKIENHGKENGAFDATSRRTVALPARWNKDGITTWFDFRQPARKDKNGDEAGQKAKRTAREQYADTKEVLVFFRIPTSKTLQIAKVCWQSMTFRTKMSRTLSKASFNERLKQLGKLDKVWPQIVAHFDAGPFSEQLNTTPPSELDSNFLHAVLRAYLS